MEHLVGSNRVVAGLADAPTIDAAGKHVIIIGGGDTGADCLGTALRQGCKSVKQFEVLQPKSLQDKALALIDKNIFSDVTVQ